MAECTKLNNNTWLIEVQENGSTKELFIEFPEDAINQVGWHEGDVLEWSDNGNGSCYIKKKEIDE
jgi:hypothetical protein